MPDQVSRLDSGTAYDVAEGGRAAAVHTLAASVLAEMREHGIMPTPRNYDLWFTYRTDMNPALTDRVRLVLDEGQALTDHGKDSVRAFTQASQRSAIRYSHQ